MSRISSIVAVGVWIASLTSTSVDAFVAPSLSSTASASAARVSGTSLFHNTAPKHDTSGGNKIDYTPEQVERINAYVTHQDGAAKIGFPTDVRSLIQYNHGFAVMGTNSKS